MSILTFLGPVTLICIFLAIFVILALSYRTVVATNFVHIVQSAKKTVSYGKGQQAGNTYYAWPSWIPFCGLKVIELPVSVFKLNLDEYDAYDKGRVPFIIDIMAFFCIDDTNTAAQRVSSFSELQGQLEGILQGASRSILAKSDIEEILEERNKFGQMFTDAVVNQLKEWGVRNVKNIELMDIRDSKDSKVIWNIMQKKKSEVEMQSRIAVAKNIQAAKQAEIDAEREVSLRDQEAKEQVGKRNADREKNVGISNQQAMQAVREQEKTTAEKSMAVTQVNQVRQAEIIRDVRVVEAEQAKRTNVIDAEGHAQATVAVAEGQARAAVAQADGEKKRNILTAEGNLAQAELGAKGVKAQGEARAAADTAVNTASVAAQVRLATEIGNNKGYQEYLVSIRRVEASQVVGVAQASALAAAHIKVIANTGNVVEGVSNVMDLFTSKGGTQLGSMLEGLANTDAGRAVLERVGVKTEDVSPSSGKNGTGSVSH